MEARALSTIQSGVPFYLPINAGEKVTILGKDEDWYFCVNRNGMVGKIPTSFAKPLNEISNTKSSAKQPSFTPPLSPRFVSKVQNGYFDDLYQTLKDNDNIPHDILTPKADIEFMDEIEGGDIDNNKDKPQTLMGHINDNQIFFNPNNNHYQQNKNEPKIKSEREYKTKFIQNLKEFGDLQNEYDDDIKHSEDDIINSKAQIQTIMGFEDDDQMIIFDNLNKSPSDKLKDIQFDHGKSPKITLMGDLNENQQIKFRFDHDKDDKDDNYKHKGQINGDLNVKNENENEDEDEEEIDIINEGITLMGINNENDKVEFMELKQCHIKQDKDNQHGYDLNVIVDDIDTTNTETLQ